MGAAVVPEVYSSKKGSAATGGSRSPAGGLACASSAKDVAPATASPTAMTCSSSGRPSFSPRIVPAGEPALKLARQTAARARLCPSKAASSAGPYTMCSVVMTPPRAVIDKYAITNSATFGSCTATTSPRPMPKAASPPASAMTRSFSSP